MQTFSDLGLSPALLSSIVHLGYETPSPVQSQAIPVLLKGSDLIAQAQTGTGKTAAFALPLLERINPEIHAPQGLVIAPTRELAIQVAEAFKQYARHLTGFKIVPIYGGQDYKVQLRALERGAHVVVATPGRAMDHMRRGTLVLDQLQTIVLDEADEMLKMGFVEDVEWILEQIPQAHQTALFSATMPESIRRVAQRYTKDAVKVTIESKTQTVEAITQVGVMVASQHKLDLLTQFLELEECDGAIVFARTRTMTAELAEKLEARGYTVAALNGDMNQSLREKVIDRMRKGYLDIIVATDVAARGIDIERVTHVFNYDIPTDPEAYVHRIGRTGRAGRQGKAILFISPREQNLLRMIERTIKAKVQLIDPPSVDQIKEKRSSKLMNELEKVITQQKLYTQRELIETLVHDTEHSELDLAAALLYLIQKEQPTQQLQEIKPLSAREGQSSSPQKRKRPFSRPRKPDGDRRSFNDRKPSHFLDDRKSREKSETPFKKKILSRRKTLRNAP